MKTGDWLGMQTPAEPRMTAQKKSRATKMARKHVSFSGIVSVLENTQVAVTGFEQVQRTPGKSNASLQGGAKSGALLAENPPLDPQLLIQAVLEDSTATKSLRSRAMTLKTELTK